MDLSSLMKARMGWSRFQDNHPKVPAFIQNVRRKGFCEGMEIAVAVRYPDGDVRKTGIRVTASDMELLNTLKGMK